MRQHCSDVGRDPAEIEATHLLTVMVGRDRKDLAERVDQARGRDQSADEYSARNNAGTVDDLVSLFESYHHAGATHSIVNLANSEQAWRLSLM